MMQLGNDPELAQITELYISERDALKELAKSGEVPTVPLLRIFDEHDELTAIITLKPHTDEASYRNALIEACIVAPSLQMNSCTIWFQTQPSGYGIIHTNPTITQGSFLTDDGETIPHEQFSLEMVDTETVLVLERFVRSPSDSSFMEEDLNVLTRRGHDVEIFKDPATMKKELVF